MRDEHGPDLFGPADADVVGHERLEEAPGPAGVVEDEGAGDLDLAHRQLPEVAGPPVLVGERGRDDRRPAVEEALDVVGAEPVADRLQSARVLTGGEAVGQLAEGETGPAGLALGPLVTVQPDLGRIGEVGADLDEAGPELGVEDVEVVDPDPAFLLDEVEAHDARLGRAVLGA